MKPHSSILRGAILAGLFPFISHPLLADDSATEINAKLEAGHEVAWLIKDSIDVDGDLAVLFAARAKNAQPAEFPYLVTGARPVSTDATKDFDNDDATKNQMVTENVVVSLKEKRVLGRLQLDPWCQYFPGRNHRGLQAVWGPKENGSRFGILDFKLRFTSGAVFIVEMNGESTEPALTQTDIGKRVESSLDSVIKKQSQDSYSNGQADFHFRFGPERSIRVRAVATTNPKQLDSQKTFCALFQGTFDLESKEWTASDTRPLTSKQYEAFSSAYVDISDLTKHMTVAGKPAAKNLTWSMGFSSEQQKADYLDKIMNDVYQATRVLLTTNRFAEVKHEQIAWLKTRDAARSVTQKSKLLEERIEKLQDLLW